MRADKFFDAIDDIPFKNYGGCLFFCYVFWLWAKLNHRDLSDYDIIQYDNNYSRVEKNIAFIKGLRKKAFEANHFSWIHNDREFDSDGIVTPCYTIIKERLRIPNHKVQVFCENALMNGSWNNKFNRNNAIDTVCDRLNINLCHLKL